MIGSLIFGRRFWTMIHVCGCLWTWRGICNDGSNAARQHKRRRKRRPLRCASPVREQRHRKGLVPAQESESDNEGPKAAHERNGEESAPVWTRLLRPGTLQCGSVLTRFARAVWLHVSRTTDSDLFWSDLRRQVAGFDEDAGWCHMSFGRSSTVSGASPW